MNKCQPTIALSIHILFEISRIRNLNILNNLYSIGMANTEHVRIRELLPRGTLEDLLSNQTGKNPKVERRIRFVLSRYDGKPVWKVCEEMGVSIQTGYNWQNQWNDGGKGFFEVRKQTGRPSQIDEEVLNKILENVDREPMTTGQIRSLIKDRCGISFTKKHIRTMLRRNGFIHPDEYLKGLTEALFPEYHDRKEKPWITKETLIALIYERKGE